jgi:hypothetical protein
MKRGMRLWIEIHEADPSARAGQRHGKVDRRGRLPNATLLIGHGDGSHEKPRYLDVRRTTSQRSGSIGLAPTPKKPGFSRKISRVGAVFTCREPVLTGRIGSPAAACSVAGGFCYGRLLDESRIARESQNSPSPARASDRLLSIRIYEKHDLVSH